MQPRKENTGGGRGQTDVQPFSSTCVTTQLPIVFYDSMKHNGPDEWDDDDDLGYQRIPCTEETMLSLSLDRPSNTLEATRVSDTPFGFPPKYIEDDLTACSPTRSTVQEKEHKPDGKLSELDATTGEPAMGARSVEAPHAQHRRETGAIDADCNEIESRADAQRQISCLNAILHCQ